MTKQEAQAAYRAAWRSWCFAKTPADKKAAEQAMDAVQEGCVDGGRPGPEWDAFKATLPGYNEHWAGLAEECERMIKKMFGTSER